MTWELVDGNGGCLVKTRLSVPTGAVWQNIGLVYQPIPGMTRSIHNRIVKCTDVLNFNPMEISDRMFYCDVFVGLKVYSFNHKWTSWFTLSYPVSCCFLPWHTFIF